MHVIAWKCMERWPNRKKISFDHRQTDKGLVHVLSCAFAAKNILKFGCNCIYWPLKMLSLWIYASIRSDNLEMNKKAVKTVTLTTLRLPTGPTVKSQIWSNEGEPQGTAKRHSAASFQTSLPTWFLTTPQQRSPGPVSHELDSRCWQIQLSQLETWVAHSGLNS